MDGESPSSESPRKRVKISNDPPDTRPVVVTPIPVTKDPPSRNQLGTADGIQAPSEDVQAMKEAEVGIIEFVSQIFLGLQGY